MNQLDWISFEIIVIYSGYISVVTQAACAILVNIEQILNYFFIGFGQGVSTVLGAEIGKGNAVLAKQKYRVIQINAFLLIVLLIAALWISRGGVFQKMTSNQDITSELFVGSDLMILGLLPAMSKVYNKGVLRTLMLQKEGMVIGLLLNWCFSFSMIYTFCVKHRWGIFGLWLAKLCTETAVYLAYTSLILLHDWELIAHKSKQLRTKLLQQLEAGKQPPGEIELK